MSRSERTRELLMRPLVWPALLALASGVGLVAALVGEGTLDLFACAGIGAPLGAIVWARLTRAQ